jgi:Uncharacterized conserved protein
MPELARSSGWSPREVAAGSAAVPARGRPPISSVTQSSRPPSRPPPAIPAAPRSSPRNSTTSPSPCSSSRTRYSPTIPSLTSKVGTHGVAVDGGNSHGWLYPTVPVENGWSGAEFLSRACRKAKIAPNAWEDDETMVTLIEGQVFRERADGGAVEEL